MTYLAPLRKKPVRAPLAGVSPRRDVWAYWVAYWRRTPRGSVLVRHGVFSENTPTIDRGTMADETSVIVQARGSSYESAQRKLRGRVNRLSPPQMQALWAKAAPGRYAGAESILFKV